MKAHEKQELLAKAADKLKMASHFAESYRKEPASAAQASTLNKLASEASAAAMEYLKAMTAIMPPRV
jgi:hypothetical protein